MVRAGMCVATGVLAAAAAWVGVTHFTTAEAAPAADAKPVDLTAFRDAVNAAAKRGENVDGIVKALDAFEKSAPKAAAGTVPPELQALRDAVDAAARKGENVEAVARELVAVETAVAGRSLAKPRPVPRPELEPLPNPGRLPAFPNPNIGAIDPELLIKAIGLREKANELLLKAAAGGGAGGLGMGGMPVFPDMGRAPVRPRLGIRMDRVPAVASEQLGLEPNTGIAVALVMPGSAAEKAGLKIHDIILEFSGKPVTDNAEDFARRVNEVKAGEKVDLVVLRKGKKVDVKGIELPDAPRRQAPQQIDLFPLLP